MNRALIAVGSIVALLAGCSTNVRVTATPGSTDLTGWYRFEGTDKVKPDDFPNPLIDWVDVALSSKIELDQTNGERIVARYTDKSGESVEKVVLLGNAPAGTAFKNGELSFQKRIPIQGPRILPGLTRHFVGTRYFKDRDGNLRVVGFFTERGLMLFLFPFTDHYEYEFVLKADDR